MNVDVRLQFLVACCKVSQLVMLGHIYAKYTCDTCIIVFLTFCAGFQKLKIEKEMIDAECCLV